MKSTVTMLVNYLRIYPVAKERISKINKVKSLKVAAFIFDQALPSPDSKGDNNVIEVTAKQLDNLCSIAHIRGNGSDKWEALAGLMETMSSVAHLTCNSHSKGETYLDGDGNEQVYTENGVNSQVDSIVLPKEVRTEFRTRLIDRVMNYKEEQDDLIASLLGGKTGASVIPEGVVADPVAG